MKTLTMEVQKEIIRQLGGNKFAVMTGATFFADGQNKLTVKFKGSRVANIMYITLNSLDLYDVQICKYRNLEVKVVDEIENCYNDDLVPFFEKTTGLRTSL